MRTVLLLGVVSFLTDASSEMIAPLMPLFLVEGLGARASFVGLVEGAATCVASVLQLVSGRLSDRALRRKPLVVGGYALSSLARPLVALAQTPWHALAVRIIDRVGKGVRSAPRDALIASAVAEANRGAAFGVQRGLDHAGAVVGPLIAFGLIAGGADLREVFAWAAAPGLLAVLATLAVREGPRLSPLLHTASTHAPPSPAWRSTLAALGVAGLGSASDAFVVLKARAVGLPVALVPWLWMALHAGRALCAWPAGRVADRLGGRRVLCGGLVLRAAALAALAATPGGAPLWAAVVAHGAAQGLTEGAERKVVTMLGGARTGAAFGAYYLVGGFAALAGGVLCGVVWDAMGPGVALGAGAVILVAAAALLAAPSR
ncbi:MAG: MFS transporter [Myxococcota bacterium]